MEELKLIQLTYNLKRLTATIKAKGFSNMLSEEGVTKGHILSAWEAVDAAAELIAITAESFQVSSLEELTTIKELHLELV